MKHNQRQDSKHFKMDLWSLPNEIKQTIYKYHILASVKDKEFKEELQNMWFKSKINKLLDETSNSAELCKDTEFENTLYDIDNSDIDMFTRSAFHECLKYLYQVLTTDSQKTRLLFHIFGYDARVFHHLVDHVQMNYVRAYVTYDSDDDAYLLGYILLEKGGQQMYVILGSLSYVWRMDNMYTSQSWGRLHCNVID